MTTLTKTGAADLFRQAPHRFLDVGGAEVGYRKVGQGPDVLFVHGWPLSSATYRCLLPHLVDHVTCHLIDLPGAGSSRFDDPTALSLDDHIESVRRVLDLLGLESVAAVGHNSGGLIARHALAGDPRLRAMALLNTEQSSGLAWPFRSFLLARRIPGFGAMLGFAARQPWKRFGLPSIRGEFDEFFLDPLHSSPNHRAAAVSLLRSFDIARVHQLADVHKRIDVPVVLVWGDSDVFFPLKLAEEMVETFPNAELKVMPGGDLMVHERQPEKVAAAMLPTLVGD